ncbi:MAG: hypothetical protein N2512_08740, partial [Armatimonadetes bacterium]|nr:hypothetical protein [Armatimonadota bacterium]
MRARSVVIALVVSALAYSACASTVELKGPGIGRSFTYGPGFSTTALFCPADGWTLRVESDELVVELQGGNRVAGPDWRLVGEPQLRARGDEKTLQVALATDKAPGLNVVIEYNVRGAQPWMRKRVTLTGPAGMLVTRVDLEPVTLRPAPPDLDGEGMPMLAGRAWFGVEYPASHNS